MFVDSMSTGQLWVSEWSGSLLANVTCLHRTVLPKPDVWIEPSLSVLQDCQLHCQVAASPSAPLHRAPCGQAHCALQLSLRREHRLWTVDPILESACPSQGLVMPPRVAPLQVVVIPIPGTTLTDAQRQELKERTQDIVGELKGKGLRIHTDDRDNYRPGWKYNHWELKASPPTARYVFHLTRQHA